MQIKSQQGAYCMNSHKHTIINVLLREGRKTATNFSFISNANQYFVELENEGLIYSEWGELGDARVKWRYIKDRELCEDYIERSRSAIKEGQSA